MRSTLSLITLAVAALSAGPLAAQPADASAASPVAPSRPVPAFPAELAGHAALPALTLIAPPADAPASLRVSGKYTAADLRRVDRPGAIEGTSFLSAPGVPRGTGISLPFRGQPVQGFSGIKARPDGSYWTLSDNGYGSRANSPDAMLMVHQVRPDWRRGEVRRLRTLFLHDPDRKVPFHIVNEGTARRYLTGADFDIESLQIIGDDLWFGDELGPYLIRTDRRGKVLAVHETRIDGRVVRSPDHFAVGTPAVPGPFSTPVRRSRGYEGMAASPDGRFLYPLLEGPLWNEADRQWERVDGRDVLRVLEFSVERGEWTGRSWRYPLELAGNNIGDFNMIDATTGLVIERDNGEGDPETACPGAPAPDGQNVPVRFKRVYKISFEGVADGGIVRKLGYVDLMDIRDPAGRARVPTRDCRFTFPFVTIENVDMVDADHIIVANDNNLPYSSGRRLGRNDDNEFILLKVPEFLRA